MAMRVKAKEGSVCALIRDMTEPMLPTMRYFTSASHLRMALAPASTS